MDVVSAERGVLDTALKRFDTLAEDSHLGVPLSTE
jgi:hypothetical protein